MLKVPPPGSGFTPKTWGEFESLCGGRNRQPGVLFFISQVTVVVANVRYNTLVNNKLKAVPLPTDAATQSVETNPFTKGINIFFSFV